MSNHLFSSVDALLGSALRGFVFMYDPKDPTNVTSVVAVRVDDTIRLLEPVPSKSMIRAFDIVENETVFFDIMDISFLDVFVVLCSIPVLGSVPHLLQARSPK